MSTRTIESLPPTIWPVLQTLAEKGKWFFPNQQRRTLTLLRDQGYVSASRKGQWSLTEAGAELAKQNPPKQKRFNCNGCGRKIWVAADVVVCPLCGWQSSRKGKSNDN